MASRNKVARRKGKGGGGDEVTLGLHFLLVIKMLKKVFFLLSYIEGWADDKTKESRRVLVEEKCSCEENQVCTHTCCPVLLCWKSTWCSHEGCLSPIWTSLQSPDLQDSPWSMEKSKEGSELRLEYREQAIDLMQELMRHKMFHRCKSWNMLWL